MSILTLLITFLGSLFKSQRQLALENLALKQQVTMLRQSVIATTCHGGRPNVLDIFRFSDWNTERKLLNTPRLFVLYLGTARRSAQTEPPPRKRVSFDYQLLCGGRVDQRTEGYLAALAKGEATRLDSEATEALPGRLIRS